MAATANSPYQAKRLQHIAGIPPNCDPQRATETFAAYVQRMWANGVWPDIGATEEDADYLTRIYQLAQTYLITGTNETVKNALTAVSASYATIAQAEIDPEASASYATYALTAGTATTAATANTASYVSASKVDGRVATATSASHARYADATSGATANAETASYVAGANVDGAVTLATNATTAATASHVEATVAAGTAVDGRASTSGYGVYAQSLLSEAVYAMQTGTITADINRSALGVKRNVTLDGGFDTKAAVFTVTDYKTTGSANLIEAKMHDSDVGYGTVVFAVDKTGSLFSSGSKGFTGFVSFHDGDTNAVSMSFQGGLFVGLV